MRPTYRAGTWQDSVYLLYLSFQQILDSQHCRAPPTFYQLSFQFFRSAIQHDHFYPLLVFLNLRSTMTHRCTTQPRRTHLHPSYRPKASSVRIPELQIHTGPHQPTDSTSANHKHDPIVTRYEFEILHQKLALHLTLLLFLLANAHVRGTRPPATAPLVRTCPTANGAHLRRDVRPFRRPPYLLRRVPTPIRAPYSSHANDADARHTRYPEGPPAHANTSTGTYSPSDAVYARTKHACGHAKSPRRLLPLHRLHQRVRAPARPRIIDFRRPLLRRPSLPFTRLLVFAASQRRHGPRQASPNAPAAAARPR
jgi:hypothetical protein